MRIGIFQLPFCNIGSIEAYCKSRNLSHQIIAKGDALCDFDALVLPGVGVFDNAMFYLQENKFDVQIKEIFSNSGSSSILIGICLGMQLLFDSSEESPSVTGLSLIDGKCIKFPAGSNHVIPHLGWNQIHYPVNSDIILPDMYFVHSYYCLPSCSDDILFNSDYILKFASAVRRGNLFGFQFHPEKSGNAGYNLFDMALGLC